MFNEYTSLKNYPKPVLDACYLPLTRGNVQETCAEQQGNLSYYDNLISSLDKWNERNSNPVPQFIIEFEAKVTTERDNVRGLVVWLSLMLAYCEDWDGDA